MFNRKRFNAALAINGLTMKELAEKMGIDPATLYRKVTGKSDFNRKEINEICQILSLESPVAIFFDK